MKLTKEDFKVANLGKENNVIPRWVIEREPEEISVTEITQALEIKERLDIMMKRLDDIRECKDPKNVDSYGCLYVMMGCSCVPLSLFKQVRDGEEK